MNIAGINDEQTICLDINMIALLDTSEDLRVCEKEMGVPCGQLLTPLTRFRLQYPERPKAIDNGMFKQRPIAEFLQLLKREDERKREFLFVSVPDVPFSARRTLEVFDHWKHERCLKGWKLALVAQNGQEDLMVPWDAIDAIFIGGDDEFKDGFHAEAIIKAAKLLGKWVHVGRVNRPGRFEKFERLGVDSIDGSGLARYSWMREDIWKAHSQPNLLTQLIG